MPYVDLSKLRAFDTETHLIQPGLLAPPLVCASIAGPTVGDERVVDKAAALRTFRGCIAGDGLIVGTNLVFDFGVMAVTFPEVLPEIFKCLEEGRAFSTDILEALHDNARGLMYRDPATGQPFAKDESGEAVGRYPQALLEMRYTGVDRSAEKADGWRLRYAELDNVPISVWPDEAIEYPRRDARGCFEIARVQLGEGRDNLQRSADEMRAAWALHLMAIYGSRVDPVMGAHVVKQIADQRDKDHAKFIAAGILRADGTADTKKIQALIEGAYRGDPPKTEKGGIKRDRDTLVESSDPLLEAYGEAGPNEKLFSTFSELLTAKAPINPSFTTLVQSGRTSCSRPNLQQLPRGGSIRECFQPRPGWVYCSVDYTANELVTLGQVCIDWFKASKIADAINAGQDLHCRLVARVIGSDYDSVYAVRKSDPLIAGLRQAMKEVNFGLPGLMGAPTLVRTARKKDVRLCELAQMQAVCGAAGKEIEYYGRPISPTCTECLSLAVKYRQLWYEEWPEMVDYHEVCKRLADDCAAGVPIESYSRGKMLRLADKPGAIANHFFQNRAAVGGKDAMWHLAKACYLGDGPLRYCRPTLFLHDEIFSEIREEALTEAADAKTKIMVDVQQEHNPDVLVTAAPAACRRWFKNADTVRKNGKLIPWWPSDWSWEPDQEVMRKDLT